MTTIRKIVTSKIDGGNADSNDINEIRPFGETAFYLDTNSNPSKLTLMMFDGVRTNQRSKVLSPGVLFGSNADSADGAGLDTIKLIPDARLHYNFGDYDNHQHLVIDPTAPNHIHIRAGGTIDNSNADLFLGGELTHVKVSDGADNVIIRTSVLGEGVFPYSWTFDNGGKLTLPGTVEYSNGTLVTGGGLVTPPGTDYIIGTQQLQTVSAECAPRGSGDNFVADITDNDDIIVVREGWTVVVDGTTYTVTTIMNGIGEFDIFATGANFVQGTTYTFTNPIPLAYDWSFGLDGVLSTPGLGTISHRNNDLKVEVTGTDVIVLRTAGGELILDASGGLMFNDGSIQTTSYPGISTVAKTGVDPLTIGKGRAATVTASPSNNTNLNVGTVTGIVFGTGFTLDITVAGNGDISAVVTDSNQAQSVGDTGTLVGGGFLGGTTPADDVVFTVATLTDVIVPTALDLTKTINKLTDGVYTLADGVEGQIMHLVRQTGSTYNTIIVNVANGRVDGTSYTTIDYYPFDSGALPALNMSTLIFTDGAWQADSGSWD